MSAPALNLSLTETDRIQIRLAALNDCAPETARAQFKRCCGSSTWIDRMERARPFSDLIELQNCANQIWGSCSREDWLEAFASHPQIGDQTASRWSRQEQAGVTGAASTVLTLSKTSQAYKMKFGYIFIICATGKSAAEILNALKQRLHNTVAIEIQNAAEEQRLIMQLRLRKLLGE